MEVTIETTTGSTKKNALKKYVGAVAFSTVLTMQVAIAANKPKTAGKQKNNEEISYAVERSIPKRSKKVAKLLRGVRSPDKGHGRNENDIPKVKKSGKNDGISVHGLAQSMLSYNPEQPASGNNLYSYLSRGTKGMPEPTMLELYITNEKQGKFNFVADIYSLYYSSTLNKITRYGNNTFGFTGPLGWLPAPEQIYFTYKPINKLALSGGKFLSLIGIEGPSSYQHINYNESIGLIIPLTPATVTGIRASYALNKKLNIAIGLNNGWDTVSDTNFLRTAEWQLSFKPSKSMEIDTEGMFGPSGPYTRGPKLYVIDNVLTWRPLSKQFKIMGEYLYEHQDAPVPGVETITNQGINAQGGGAWLVFKPKTFRIAFRNEIITDPSGTRTGISQHLLDSTMTIGKWITPHLLLDFEYRHNWSTAHPFEDGSKADALAYENIIGARISLTF